MPKGSILGPVLFNSYINGLDEDMEEMLIKLAGFTEMGEAAYSLEDRISLQEDWRTGLEKTMSFRKEKCKV